MTTLLAVFLGRCETYRLARGISRSYLSRLLFDDGKILGRLTDRGADISVRRLANAEDKLSGFERQQIQSVAA
jgi:hypothetical protein